MEHCVTCVSCVHAPSVVIRTDVVQSEVGPHRWPPIAETNAVDSYFHAYRDGLSSARGAADADCTEMEIV